MSTQEKTDLNKIKFALWKEIKILINEQLRQNKSLMEIYAINYIENKDPDNENNYKLSKECFETLTKWKEILEVEIYNLEPESSEPMSMAFVVKQPLFKGQDESEELRKLYAIKYIESKNEEDENNYSIYKKRCTTIKEIFDLIDKTARNFEYKKEEK